MINYVISRVKMSLFVLEYDVKNGVYKLTFDLYLGIKSLSGGNMVTLNPIYQISEFECQMSSDLTVGMMWCNASLL